MPNLAELMGIGKGGGAGTTGPGAAVPGSMPPPGGAGGAPPAGANITNLMKTMPASGIRNMASSIFAMLVKVAQVFSAAYDLNSEEGKAINAGIRSFGKLSKGQQTGDMKSIVQSLVSALPPNMQNMGPGGLNQAFTQLMGQQGGGAPPGMPPPGGGGGGAPSPPGPLTEMMQ